MDVRLHDSVDEFRAFAEPLYRRDPVAHTIELTLLLGGTFPDDSLLLTLWRDGEPLGAALQTPPYPLVCSGIPPSAVDAATAELVDRRPGLPGVRGMRTTALTFAEAWQAMTGQTATVNTEERLYRLGTLRTPVGVRGSGRLATDEDRDLIVDWVGQFFGEAFSGVSNDGAEFVDAAERKGDRFTLWTVDDVLASRAMLRAPAADASRIGPVFTPPDCRGHGYGSAVTAAAAAQLAHRSGTADVVLFADLANPVSNSIYQRIGFEAVADCVRVDFASAG